MQQLTYRDLTAMLKSCDAGASSWHRRHTLLALTDLAAKARGAHDPRSRWRLKNFRAALSAMEGNDEIEVTGETLDETLMLAMAALDAR